TLNDTAVATPTIAPQNPLVRLPACGNAVAGRRSRAMRAQRVSPKMAMLEAKKTTTCRLAITGRAYETSRDDEQPLGARRGREVLVPRGDDEVRRASLQGRGEAQGGDGTQSLS